MEDGDKPVKKRRIQSLTEGCGAVRFGLGWYSIVVW